MLRRLVVLVALLGVVGFVLRGSATAPERVTANASTTAALPKASPPVRGASMTTMAPTPRSPAPAPVGTPQATVVTLRNPVQLAQLTGPGSINATDTRWNVYGADLGHMFWHNGSLMMVFGDTYGPAHSDWRSNTLVRIDKPDPATGLRFTSMVTDRSGAAAQLLGSLKVDGVEHTVIPTSGISVGSRMILHYMSVRRWLTPGRWELNDSGLAYSDDNGATWVKDPAAEWGGSSNFGQAAFVSSGHWVYVFGIPAGRFGSVELARVEQANILRLGTYQYWNGSAWTPDEHAASPIVPAPVGELSVRWSASLQRWMMLYLNESRAAVVLRTAPQLTGPWSGEQIVATAAQYPQLYAPYFVPIDTGRDVYFVMSQGGPYEVFLMRATLQVLPVSH